MRRLVVALAFVLGSCGSSKTEVEMNVRRAALQELVGRLSEPSYPYSAACIAVDSAVSVDGLHEPPEGFTESISSNRLELRRFGECVENPGRPGFLWDTTSAARAEVLVGVERVESLDHDRASVEVLWLASGTEGEVYRCEVIRRGRAWVVEECVRTEQV